MVKNSTYRLFALFLAVSLIGMGLIPALGDCSGTCCCHPENQVQPSETRHREASLLKNCCCGTGGESCGISKDCSSSRAGLDAVQVAQRKHQGPGNITWTVEDITLTHDPGRLYFNKYLISPRASPRPVYLMNLSFLF